MGFFAAIGLFMSMLRTFRTFPVLVAFAEKQNPCTGGGDKSSIDGHLCLFK